MPEFPIPSARTLLVSQIQGGQLLSLPPCPVRLCLGQCPAHDIITSSWRHLSYYQMDRQVCGDISQCLQLGKKPFDGICRSHSGQNGMVPSHKTVRGVAKDCRLKTLPEIHFSNRENMSSEKCGSRIIPGPPRSVP